MVKKNMKLVRNCMDKITNYAQEDHCLSQCDRIKFDEFEDSESSYDKSTNVNKCDNEIFYVDCCSSSHVIPFGKCVCVCAPIK